ncbi:MAG: enoyl-CoA hydratase-related protein [Smithellaceae bacterium]
MAKIQYRAEDRVSIITFDDGKVNAMNWDFFHELNESLNQAEKDQAGALIFTCRPGIFSAGLDLKLMAGHSLMEQLKFLKYFAATMLRVYQFPIPTIAAYRGHSVAGGVILSYACDRFVVSDGPYKIQLNEVANKMLLPSWILLICRSSIPPQYWTEALLHARAYTPAEALKHGLVDDVVSENGDIDKAAMDYARGILHLHGPAYAAAKKLMREEEATRAMNMFEKEVLEWYITQGTPAGK